MQDVLASFLRKIQLVGLTVCVVAAAALAGCNDARERVEPAPAARAPEPTLETTAPAPAAAEPRPDPTARQALFGAVHVHTSYSFDAFTNGTVSRPQDAYKWARGEPIRGNKAGLMLQIQTPLDFYAVSDHAEMMGVFPLMTDPQSPLSKHPMAERVLSEDMNVAMQAFAEILREFSAGNLDPAFTDPEVSRSVWEECGRRS